MDDGHPIIRIVIFIILLLIDAAFTGTEVAVSAVNESVLTKKKEEGDSRAARILRFVGQPAAFMSTIDLIGAAVTIIAGAFVARPFFTDTDISPDDPGTVDVLACCSYQSPARLSDHYLFCHCFRHSFSKTSGF